MDGLYSQVMAALSTMQSEPLAASLNQFSRYIQSFQRQGVMPAAYLPVMKLMRARSSRLAAIRLRGGRVVSYEKEHALMVKHLTNIIEMLQFAEETDRHPGEADACAERLAIRLVHCLYNRRLELFRQMREFLNDYGIEILRNSPCRRMTEGVLAGLWTLAPADDPEPWIKIAHQYKDRTLDGIGMPPALARAVDMQRVQRAWADKLLPVVLADADMAAVRAARDRYLKDAGASASEEAAREARSRFLMLQLLAPAGPLDRPAVLLWYMQQGEEPSQVPEHVKGRNLFAGIRVRDGQSRLVVQNHNTSAWLEGERVGLSEDKLAQIREALVRSSGRYLFALVRASEPHVIRNVWEVSGSIDLTGRLVEGVDLLEAGKKQDGLAMLERTAGENPHLAGPHRLLAVAARDGEGTAGHDRARKHLLEEQRRDPLGGRAEASLGILAKREGKREEAATLLEKSLEIQPHSIDHLLTLASLHVSWDAEHLAGTRLLDLCAHAFDLNPDDQGTRDFLMKVRVETGLDLPAYVLIGELDTSIH